MIHSTGLHYRGSRTTGAGGHVLSFAPESEIRFDAGQHGLWLIPGGGAGPFSIASAPGDETFELGTVLHHRSRLKSALASLEPGDTVRFIGPLGNLAPPAGDRPIVLIAQGIGITPIRSLLRQPTSAHRTLLHVGAHHLQDETRALADRASYPADRGALLDQLAETVTEQPDAHFLLAGTRAFVHDTGRQLRSAGVPSGRIRRDPFYGASERAARVPSERPRMGVV